MGLPASSSALKALSRASASRPAMLPFFFVAVSLFHQPTNLHDNTRAPAPVL